MDKRGNLISYLNKITTTLKRQPFTAFEQMITFFSFFPVILDYFWKVSGWFKETWFLNSNPNYNK